MDPLAKLLGSPARLKTLRLFVFNQGTAFTPREIAERLKLSSAIVRREIAELLGAGALRKKNAGTGTRYQTNPHFEHLSALDTFIHETSNVRPHTIMKALRRGALLQLVALSGLFTEVLESQIDLLIVGDRLNERVLSRAVRSLEAELGREIRYACFTTTDFRYRYGVYDRLLRDVFDYPHRLLIDKIGL